MKGIYSYPELFTSFIRRTLTSVKVEVVPNSPYGFCGRKVP